jgi:uncharacterized membrane protein (UPF0127 family)
MKIFAKNKEIFNNARFVSGFGLMFKRKLKKDEAVILTLPRESRINSAIHMVFVFYSIYVIWANKEKVIIDIKKAYPFQLFLMPNKEAMYVIECCYEPELIIGDKLDF